MAAATTPIATATAPRPDDERLVRETVETAVRQTGLATDVAVLVRRTVPTARCIRCGLSAAVRGVRLDDAQICTECRRFDRYKERLDLYFHSENSLARLFEENSGNRRSDVDCLLLFSGGKDSTYVLYQLVNMGLKVVTFTFDNGFISAKAFENIHRITSQLGVEHHTATHAEMNTVFRESLNRHSTVCKGCFKALLDLSLIYADRRGINFIVNGLSRGQIVEERLAFFYDRNIFDPAIIDEKLAEGRRVYHQAERYRGLEGQDFGDSGIFDRVRQIDYFRYSAVSKKEIYTHLKTSNHGWEEPTDTGFCSSNCLINDVGISVHTAERGYSNYEVPTAWEVRLGHLDRTEAMAELGGTPSAARVATILDTIRYPQKAHMAPNTAFDVFCVSSGDEKVSAIERTIRDSLPHLRDQLRFSRVASIERFPNGALKPIPFPIASSAVRDDAPPAPVSEITDRDEAAHPAQAVVLTDLHIALLARCDQKSGWVTQTLKVPATLDQTVFRRALLHSLTRHPRLRLRCPASGSPHHVPVSTALPLKWFDLTKNTAAERGVAERKLPDFLSGKLMASSGDELFTVGVVMPGADGHGTMCLVGARALMDDQSWHLLVAELESACSGVQADAGRPSTKAVAARKAEVAWPGASDLFPAAASNTEDAFCATSSAAVIDRLSRTFAEDLVILRSALDPDVVALGHYTPHNPAGDRQITVIVSDVARPALRWLPMPRPPVLDPGRSWITIAPHGDGVHLVWTANPASPTDQRLMAAVAGLTLGAARS